MLALLLAALALQSPDLDSPPLESPVGDPRAGGAPAGDASTDPGAAPAPARPEGLFELDLGQGRRIVGALVKETAEDYFVDVGFTILAVPRRAVRELERLREDAPEEPGEPAGAVEGRLYSLEGWPEASVRENVARVGEAVVGVRVPGSLGSGLVLHPEGWIVTAAHVISGEQKISVTVFEQEEMGFEKRQFDEVEIVAVNNHWDLALLRIPPEKVGGRPLKSVPLGRSSQVRVGEAVFAIGSPFGLERSVSEGIVSLTNRAHEGLLWMQTTAPLNPGNSGGPVFDLRGRVVGVVSRGPTEGLNFAVPASTLIEFLDNRDSFSFDKEQPNSGYRYLPPPPKGARVGE